MRCVDVFAGIGGMHLAAGMAGFKCLWACEIDPVCRTVYQANHGILPHPEIAVVDPASVPDHELCLVGLPCQSYSAAGHRLGLEDQRAAVFASLLRFLAHKRPPVCLIENVPGLVSHDGGRSFSFIRECLRGLGFKVSWQVLAATEFGGATLRRRVYIVASRTGKFDFSRLERQPARCLADVLESDVRTGWLTSEQYTLLDEPRLSPRSGLRFAGYRNKPFRVHGGNPALSGTHCEQNRIYDAAGVGPTIKSQDSSGRYWTAVGGGVRKLTLRELSRLQGFPERFSWPGTGATVRMLGNSIHVPTVAALCRSIGEQLLG